MTEYFIHNGITELGPFSIQELAAQNLLKDTPVWHLGLPNWSTAADIEELKHLLISKPTPPPYSNAKTAVKSSPPKLAESETVTIETATASYDERLPEKKKSKRLPVMIVIAILLLSLSAWGLWQYNETIGTLEEKITTQEVKTSEKESAADNAEEERQRINRANTEKNMNFRNNWQTYIQLHTTDPKIDHTFGGISRFNVNITNETSYKLDQVDVTINYIRKNGNVCQTETVSLFNISAGSNGSVTAPSSANGVQVSCEISKIVSNKMHFCYPDGNGDGGDPYFCR